MSEDETLQRSLAPMRDEPDVVELSADARARIVAGMRRDVRTLPRILRRRRVVRLVAIGVSLAACAALGVWRFTEWPRAEDTASIVATGVLEWTDREHVAHALRGEERIVGDAQFEVPAGSEAALTTPNGVRVRLAEKTRMRVRAAAERVELDRGTVQCQVPKLGPERTFEVQAGTARVIVHGTAFQVTLDGSQAPCVHVSEGLVEVQNDGKSVMLRPGESWGCTKVIVAAPPATVVDAPTVEHFAPPRVRARHHRRAEIADARRDSTLGQENAVLTSALHAERSRDTARARALFEELLRRFPDSPLAPEAREGAQRNAL